MPLDPTKPSDSYAEWVRRVLRRARASGGRIATLFDSSVPEPKELLTAIVERGFAPPVSDRYVSAFTGGNPYVIGHLASHYGVDAGQILCTTGATGALSLVYRAFAAPGEHILVETPGFDLFAVIAQSLGIRVGTFARTGDRFGIDVDAIEAALQPDTRLIVLSNLHNPSGHEIDRETLARLAAMAERRGVRVVIDEVYLEYTADGATARCAASLSPAFISVSSLTKIYGLSTLRCGWIIAAPEAIEPVRHVAERLDFGLSNLSHAVAAMVFDERDRFDAYWRDVLAQSRPLIEAAFAAWRAEGLIEGELPAHGCIAFPRLRGVEDTLAFSDWLCDRHGLIVAPGEYFGAPGHIRIGFAIDVLELDYALGLLGEGLRAYAGRGAEADRAEPLRGAR